PLVIVGRVLLLPFRAALEKVVAFTDGFLTSISESLSVEDWRNRMDQEILWLHGGGDTNEVDEVLASIHEFGTTMVDDVMVPRGDVVGISVDATVEEARVLAKEEGFSRYPVYRDSMDNVVGVLHVLDLLHANPKDTIKGLARDPLITNATKSVERLLSEFQGSYNQLAVVADEFGGIAGIATVEDLLEELVGEIHDETDNKENPVRRVEAGVYIVEATARVDELNESLGLNLPEGEYDTLGGLVLERLERIPRIGERLQEDEVGIEVAAAEPNRIHTIRLTVRKETAKRHDG
ncbi:MAG: HlyC/CorC family transporter, partial [Candidatus Eisenbacteria bacterium]|nr:HlyC/CorC family transporter [Candidatus Eisenbacteria bacterium]